jgi:hypothetical protein
VPAWKKETEYAVGDIVKPTPTKPDGSDNYTGFVYKCTRAGTSGKTEPEWPKDMVTQIYDGVITEQTDEEEEVDTRVRWVAYGSLELEG